MYGGYFAKGFQERGDQLKSQRMKVAQAFEEFKRNNPYATYEDFRAFSEQVAGGSPYLKGGFPADEVLKNLAQQNAKQKAIAETERQRKAQMQDLEFRKEIGSLIDDNILDIDDDLQLQDHVLSYFPEAEDMTKDQIRGMIQSYGVPQKRKRKQQEYLMDILPSIKSVIDMGGDPSDVYGDDISKYSFVRDAVKREQEEYTRRKQKEKDELDRQSRLEKRGFLKEAENILGEAVYDPYFDMSKYWPELKEVAELYNIVDESEIKSIADQALERKTGIKYAKQKQTYKESQVSATGAGLKMADERLEADSAYAAGLSEDKLVNGVMGVLTQEYHVPKPLARQMVAYGESISKGKTPLELRDILTKQFAGGLASKQEFRQNQTKRYLESLGIIEPKRYADFAAEKRTTIRTELAEDSDAISRAIENGDILKAKAAINQLQKAKENELDIIRKANSTEQDWVQEDKVDPNFVEEVRQTFESTIGKLQSKIEAAEQAQANMPKEYESHQFQSTAPKLLDENRNSPINKLFGQ